MARAFLASLILLLGLTPAFASTATSLLGKARTAQSQGKSELAERLAQSAIVADPADPAAYIGLGEVYAHEGKNDFAHNYYDKALDVDPRDPAALKAIAALARSEKSDTASAAP